MALLTIGIPVYNAMPFLREAVSSILTQTANDFEILAINDGSTDDSLEYLNSVRDPRLRVVSQENQGLTATLNRMLNESRTPWLVRMDADDISCARRLDLVLEAIHRTPDAGMFYSRAAHHQHPGAISLVRSTEGSPAELSELTRQGYLLSICHSSVVLNVKKTAALGGYRFDLHVEDLDLWWRMALEHRIEFIPEVTVAYRLNNMSICSRNLEELNRNTLYIQYLLLSRLANLRPRALAEICPVLDRMVDRKRLSYRGSMWKAAIAVSNRSYGSAGLHLLRAVASSPGRVLARCSYPWRRKTCIRVGESPALFRRFAGTLWDSLPADVSELSLPKLVQP